MLSNKHKLAILLLILMTGCGQPDVYTYPQITVSPLLSEINLSCPVPSPQPTCECHRRGRR